MKVKKKSQKQRVAQRRVLMATQRQEEPAKTLIAQADHHQGHVHYGDAAGKQCTCNVLSLPLSCPEGRGEDLGQSSTERHSKWWYGDLFKAPHWNKFPTALFNGYRATQVCGMAGLYLKGDIRGSLQWHTGSRCHVLTVEDTPSLMPYTMHLCSTLP